MTTYGIRTSRLGRLDREVAALNKRAVRLGVAPLTYARTGVEWCDFKRERNAATGKFTVRGWDVSEVELGGGSIGLPGWTFLGTVEHLDGMNVLRSVPGQTIPEQYRTGQQACGHCGLDRRRSDTFIVQHDDGQTVQLGRSCTADYLGHADPARLAAWLEAMHDLTDAGGEDDDERDERLPRYRETWRPTDVVAVARGAVRAFGWVSAKSAEATHQPRTSARVGSWLAGGKARTELEAKGMTVEAEDFSAADADIEWAREQRGNDYLLNLHALAVQERVDAKATGLLASLPAAHDRAIETATEKAAREALWAKEKAEAAPAPEGKVVVEGIVTGTREVASEYGVQHKMTVRTADGWRCYVTIPSSISDAATGDTVRFTATLEPSRDDATFCFGKRPTKGEIIESAVAEGVS